MKRGARLNAPLRDHPVMDVIDRAPGYAREHGDDMPDVRDWTRPAADPPS